MPKKISCVPRGCMAKSSCRNHGIQQMALSWVKKSSRVLSRIDMSGTKVELLLNYHENDVLGVSLGD